MKLVVAFVVFFIAFSQKSLISEESIEKVIHPSNKELYVVHHMGQIIEQLRSPTMDNIWPKFRLKEPALLTFQTGHVLAFNLNTTDTAWRKLSVNGQLALFSSADKWGVSQSPLNLAFPIENDHAYVFAFEVFERDPFLPFLTFIHERFHQHQFSNFTDESGLLKHISYEDHLNSENLALIKIEEALLIDFLEAKKTKKTKKFRRKLLKRFIAIHTLRTRLLSPQSLQWEHLQQKMEGGADYVSIKLLDTHPIIPKFDAIEHMQRLMLNYFNDRNIVEGAIQWRHYGVGAVLGYALDDLHVRDWKEEVEKGKNLSDVLDENLNLSESEILELAGTAMLEYDYFNLKKMIGNQLTEYLQAISDFQNKYAESQGVIVTINKPGNQELDGGGRVAHTFQLSNGRSLSLFCSSTASVRDKSWKLSFKDMPLLFQSRLGDHEFKMEKALNLKIDNEEVSLETLADRDQEKSFDSISWRGTFSEFVSEDHPGKILSKEGKVFIVFE